MEESLHPAYVRSLTARNRLTDARDAVYRLLDGLPMHKRVAVANLYCELCCIQGRLEKLLEDVPTVIHIEPRGLPNRYKRMPKPL